MKLRTASLVLVLALGIYPGLPAGVLYLKTALQPELMYEASGFFATGDDRAMTEEESRQLGAQLESMGFKTLSGPCMSCGYEPMAREVVLTAKGIRFFIELPFRAVGLASVFAWAMNTVHAESLWRIEQQESEPTQSAKK